jgi:YesN/AraC family two-component response regulator
METNPTLLYDELLANASSSGEPLPLSEIEERYRLEDEFLYAVRQGNYQQAMSAKDGFGKYRLESRNADSMRENKNYLIILNTLMRKAVQEAAVHPAHIDSTSANFAIRIEAARNAQDLSGIIDAMMRKYCLLVQNHSLRQYSKPIQQAINYIDFHFTEQISLEKLAAVAAISASYLSSQFKKETGTSVVDYIYQQRMRKVLTLLVTTSMPINKVAEAAGFYDENYFARAFKKRHHMTPREYRKMFQAKK